MTRRITFTIMRSLSNSRISSLQSVRFVFAVMIFCHHYFISFAMHEQLGLSSVAFFFILSGFVSSMGYSERVLEGQFDYKRFIISRVKKLAPLNIVCLLLWLTPLFIKDVVCSDYHILRYCSLLVDALMIQSWIPFEWGYFSGNAVAWFLSSIMFCYLMFPLVMKFLNKCKWGLLGVLAMYFIVLQFVPEGYIDALVYINPLFRLVDFTFGIGLYLLLSKAFSHFNVRLGFVSATLIELSAIGLFVGSFFIMPYLDLRYSTASLFWIPSLILISILAINDIKQDGGGTLFASKRGVHTTWRPFVPYLHVPLYIHPMVVGYSRSLFFK